MRFFRILALLTILPSIGLAATTGSVDTGTTSTGSVSTVVLSTGMSDFSGINSLISKVFQVNVYQYDANFDSYSLVQYGSAVLVDKDKIVTNAHVVYSEGKSYYYQICKTTTIKNIPTCFTTASLVRLDLDNDLALLKLQDSVKSILPVVLLSGDKEVGDKINILGYPQNGGNTITITDGSIAGYSKGYYKVDANLDGGNSGGGAFDSNGYLVGIPSFLKQGYSSLGYILESGIVRLFLIGTLGDAVSPSTDKKFSNYISRVQVINAQDMIDNALFSTEQLSDYGLYLTSLTEKNQKYLYNYTLNSLSGDLFDISLHTVQFSSKTTPKQYANQLASYYRNAGAKVLVTTKDIDDNLWYVVLITNKDDGNMSYIYIQNVSRTNILLSATLNVYDGENTNYKKAVSFIESLATKPLIYKNPPLETPQFQFAGQQYSVYKGISDSNVDVFFVPQNARFFGVLSYFNIGTELEEGFMADMVDSYTSAIDNAKSSLQYSTEKKPFYAIDYKDDNGSSHLAALWLVQEKGTYYSIVSDLLLSTSAIMQEAKKALQSFKVNSLLK